MKTVWNSFPQLSKSNKANRMFVYAMCVGNRDFNCTNYTNTSNNRNVF